MFPQLQLANAAILGYHFIQNNSKFSLTAGLDFQYTFLSSARSVIQPSSFCAFQTLSRNLGNYPQVGIT